MAPEFSREKIRKSLDPLLSEISGIRGPLPDDCLILQNLGIGGDDADEMLEEIHSRFGTGFEGFAFTTYFPSEHEVAGERWLRRLGFQDSRKPLSVGHLVDVIQRGAWFEPPELPQPWLPSGNIVRRNTIRGALAALMPVCYSLIAVAVGEYGLGLSPGLSLLLFGLPACVVMAVILWRRLPAN